MQAGVFGSGELNHHGLADERVHAERMLLVASGMVQVGERTQRCQDCTAGVQHLDPQGVERRGGSGFRSVNVQPENQGCTGFSRGNGHGLRG